MAKREMVSVSNGKRRASIDEGCLATQPPQTENYSWSVDSRLDSQSQGLSESRSNKRARVADVDSQLGASSQSQLQSQSQAEASGYPSQPNNQQLPSPVVIEKRREGITRIVSWNICGLAACLKKGFKLYVEAEDPDILILTETKINNPPIDPWFASRFPHQYWSFATKKGYSGTAILSKIKPLGVTQTLPDHPEKDIVKGRLITLEFPRVYLVGTYVPNAGEKLKTLPVKEEWNKHFEKYLHSLDGTKPVIWTGDLNVAPTALDLTNAKRNWNKTAGYTASETEAYARILKGVPPPLPSPTDEGYESGIVEQPETATQSHRLVDVWRERHPDWKHYTYWSYRWQCRHKGIGWRLDMFVVSERLLGRVKDCWIRDEIYGPSDHCPIVLDLEGSL